jgi:hypothetical protein
MDENKIETSLEVCIDETLILTRGNLPMLPNETIAAQTLSTNEIGMRPDLLLSCDFD